jgi:hypothetical protein
MTGRQSANKRRMPLAADAHAPCLKAPPQKRLPAGLAVLFGEHPFPQSCREVYPR